MHKPFCDQCDKEIKTKVEGKSHSQYQGFVPSGLYVPGIFGGTFDFKGDHFCSRECWGKYVIGSIENLRDNCDKLLKTLDKKQK